MRRTISTISFSHSYRLIIGIILVIMYLWAQKKYPKVLHFAFTDLLPSSGNVFSQIRKTLVILILLTLSTYLAHPQRVNDSENIKKNGIDIVLTLDISGSMDADDIPPKRIDVAKQVLQKFITQLKTDRVGMVVFAGKPFVSVPLTFDMRIFEDILKRTSTESIDQRISWLQGTAIGDALLSALKTLEKGRKDLKDDKKREQVIILLTDGAANTGIDPLVVAKLATEQQVKIYTIGIGSVQGWSIAYQTPFGIKRQKVEGVDETTLQEIAKITWWHYRRATNATTFQSIFDELSKLEKNDIEIEQVVTYKDARTGILLLLGILILLRWWREWKRVLLPR